MLTTDRLLFVRPVTVILARPGPVW